MAAKPAPFQSGLRLRLRWQVLRTLWLHRYRWRVQPGLASLRTERDHELADTVPIVALIALMVALLLFIVLPNVLGEQSTELLGVLWPFWVVQVAPMLCALLLALLNAPNIALELTERELAGDFNGPTSPESPASASAAPGDAARTKALHNATRNALAAHRCVPLVMAHAMVCVACTVLVVAFSMLLGLGAQTVLAVGDVRATAAVIFTAVSPLAWLRTVFNGWALGLVCTLAAVVYAWPGTQHATRALDIHRLGVRTMLVSAVACVLAGLAFNWVAGVLGWQGGLGYQ
jgi:hypothetical protein